MIYKEAKAKRGAGQKIAKLSQPLYNIWELANGKVIYLPIGVMAISPELLLQCPGVPLDELEHVDWYVQDVVSVGEDW